MNPFLFLFLFLVACSSEKPNDSTATADADAAPPPTATVPTHGEAGPGTVFSMHYGPYTINPGTEGVYCLDQQGPAVDTWISGWRSTSAFTHHVNIWQNTSGAHYGTRTECSLATRPGTGFFGVEGRDATVMLSEAPEYAGVAELLPKTADLMWNVHELNATSKPGEVEVSVDFFPAERHDLVANGFSLNNSPSLAVPPMTTKLLRYTVTSPAKELKILLISSHVHAHNRYAAVSVGGIEVYRSTDWTAPLVEKYDSLHGGDLIVPPSTEITWECEVDNTTASTLLNTNSVQGGEMCIVFGLMLSDSKWFYVAP